MYGPDARCSTHKDFEKKLKNNKRLYTLAILGDKVTENDAPTVVWGKTITKSFDEKSRDKCFRDNEKKYGKKYLVGEKGTVFLFDARCYHRQDPFRNTFHMESRGRKKPRLEKRRRRMVFIIVGKDLSKEDKKWILDIHPSAHDLDNQCVIDRIIK